MKKFYLLLNTFAMASIALAQNGQIQNGGFENWSNETIYDYPTQWISSNVQDYRGVATVFKSTDAFAGSFSAELRSEAFGSAPDTASGFVALGQFAGDGPSGGTPYTDVFNTVKFKYKCNLPENGDSLYLIVFRFTGGVMTEMISQKAVGGVQNTWTNGSVTITANPQDELFVGFIVGEPFAEIKCAPGSWARIDNVEIFNNSTQTAALPDYGFEDWTAMTIENPDNWYTINDQLAGIAQMNVNKSTNSNSGTYAAEISTVQFPPVTGDTIRGFISVGPIDVNNWMNQFSPIPYNATPTMFSGSYNYSPSNMDQGAIQITFYEMGTVIGSTGMQPNPTMGYNTFNLPLTITGTPDSISIVVFSGNKPGSVLLIDNFSLSGGNVGLEEFSKFDVNIYPNPASDDVMIKCDGTFSMEMVDLSGKKVLSAENLTGAQSFDVSSFSKGTYLIKLVSTSGTEVQQLVIK